MHAPAVIARRSRTRRAAVAWGLAALDLTVFVLSLAAWQLIDGSVTTLDIVTVIAIPLAFGGVGALLSVRVASNPIGPLLLASTTGLAMMFGSQPAVQLSVRAGVDGPVVALIGLLPGMLFVPSLLLVLVGVPLVFPDGRLLSRRWGWVAVLTAIVIIPVELAAIVAPGDVMGIPGLVNPLANPELHALLQPLQQAAALLALPLLLAAFASLVVRYRRSDDVGRHQIRWLAAAVTVAVVAFSISFNAPEAVRQVAETIGLMSLVFVPITIGIAIVRYRLYEIDRIISRGISYTVISALLVAAYAAVVLVLQGPLGGLVGEGTVPVAISTLVVASMFQPVSRRVQRTVDRRFDRARIDAERTSEAFTERLRDEVDIDAVVRDLAGTVETAVRPSGVRIWLRDAAG